MIAFTLLIVLIAYSLFSYGFTEPNLVLLQLQWYQQFQQYMWKSFFHNHQLTAWVFLIFLLLLFVLYGFALHYSRSRKTLSVFFLGIFLPLIFSYNALSHDVFNYAFNAKMVAEYGENPHEKVALDFVQFDDWVRFMHNTHTPAPYGYGWTAVSLLPYILSGKTFFLTWLHFKALGFISLCVLYFVLTYYAKQKYGRQLNAFELLLVFANPLLYIETVSNAHNDVWMMVLALLSFGLLYQAIITRKKVLTLVALSAAALLSSIAIKLVTVVLVPFWLLLLVFYCKKQGVMDSLGTRLPNWLLNLVHGILVKIARALLTHLEDFSVIFLLLPLLTQRSQQFLPWYLIWSLVWLPFTKSTLLRTVLLTLSLSSMVRYVPWIIEGGYSELVHRNELLITWVPLVFVFCIYCVSSRFRRSCGMLLKS